MVDAVSNCEFTGCTDRATHELEPLPLPGLHGTPPPMLACDRHFALAMAAKQRRAEADRQHEAIRGHLAATTEAIERRR